MFAIVVVGHGEFSTGLKNAAEMIEMSKRLKNKVN